MKTKISVNASKKLDIKCTEGGAEKILRRCNWSVDDFDAMEIQRGELAKFDCAGVWSYG